MKKVLLILLTIVIVGIGVFVYFHFFFVFGEGVKTGQLNYLTHKGYIFKTYEGKLIQTGLTSSKPGAMESNYFEFSVAQKSVADSLMLAGGKEVQLAYKEYLGTIPWRGHSKYVVYKIIAIQEPSAPTVPGNLKILE